MIAGQGPIVTATLRSVVFGDGQFVAAPLWPSGAAQPSFGDGAGWWTRGGGGQIAAVTSDGQTMQGIDEQRAFEQFRKELRAITEVGLMARIQAWDQIEALAQALTPRPQAPPLSLEDLMSTRLRQVAARRPVQTRKFKGEAAADQLAQIYSSLPTLLK
jgi:hypothetical protein